MRTSSALRANKQSWFSLGTMARRWYDGLFSKAAAATVVLPAAFMYPEVVSSEAATPGAAPKLASGPFIVSNASYPANRLIEDRWDVKYVPKLGSRDKGKLLSVVIDGHGGWQAAEFVRNTLLATCQKELEHATDASDPIQTALAMVRAYQRVDRAFLSAVRPAYQLGFGETASVGCCAITVATCGDKVVVANAGDCRGVLGRISLLRPLRQDSISSTIFIPDYMDSMPPYYTEMDPELRKKREMDKQMLEDNVQPNFVRSSDPYAPESGMYNNITFLHEPTTRWVKQEFATNARDKKVPYYVGTVPLSLDHNAFIERERKRLEREHPNEENIVLCKPNNPTACYVKGRLQPTRAFGDAYLKESEFNCPKGLSREWGRHVAAPYSPPYITSIPEIRIQSLKMQKKEFDSTSADNATIWSAFSDGRFGASTLDWLLALVGYNKKEPETNSNLVPNLERTRDDTGVSFIVLACDGVWDVLSNEEATSFIAEEFCKAMALPDDDGAKAGTIFAEAQSQSKAEDDTTLVPVKTLQAPSSRAIALAQIADKLKEHVLAKTAAEYGMTVPMIKSLSRGKNGRRGVHDDITAVVIFFDANGGPLFVSNALVREPSQMQ